MKMINRVTSTVLVFSLLFACNFCLVECVFASGSHDPAEQTNSGVGDCHKAESDQDHSNSDKHEAGSSCCPSLVAIKAASSDLTGVKLVKELFSQPAVLERSISQSSVLAVYKAVFPPGTSPPAVYLLTHFTHAPPISV